MYSKARFVGAGGPVRPPGTGIDAGTGAFIGDAASKQEKAWPALRAAAAKYLTGLTAALRAFNGAAAASGAEPASAAGGDVRRLAQSEGYPVLYPLQEILREWNPDIVTVPACECNLLPPPPYTHISIDWNLVPYTHSCFCSPARTHLTRHSLRQVQFSADL